MSLKWTLKSFDELTPHELYGILKLRIQVFMIEQTCWATEADDHDQAAMHLFASNPTGIVAYARILPPNYVYHGQPCEFARFGRVVVDSSQRGSGVGRELAKRAIKYIDEEFKCDIEISAQAYLGESYERLGFKVLGEGYLEDDIPHVRMLRCK